MSLSRNSNHNKKIAIQKPDNTVEYASFEGVMPDAEELAKLEAVCPGAAKKWMDLAESEITSRQQNEKKVISVFQNSTYLGQTLAFISTCLILTLAYLFLKDGHPNAGATMVVSSIASVVGAYVTNAIKKSK